MANLFRLSHGAAYVCVYVVVHLFVCCSVCLMVLPSTGERVKVEPLKEKGVNMAVASRSPTFDITRDFIDKIELQPMFVAQEKAVMVPSRKCCSVSRR
uniref:Predicted protein n=1 Tax=Hordeum vulgare subsp. vulgare TaxID=112509 RepID=F2E0C6_HORVV|nr:predicted protein [Hordeum vulgare subsp. vulgare]